MKILHVLNTDRFSGAENVACRIIEMFRDDADTEMAYCSRDGQIRTVLKRKNITFCPINGMSRESLSDVIQAYQPDILHAHDFRASIVCSRFAPKIPVISHLHNNPPWLKKAGLKSLAYGWSCRKYRHILTVSDSVFREFIFGEHFRGKQSCIGNPIDTASIRSRAVEYDCDRRYDVCFCGRLSVPKNPIAFVEICSKLPPDTTAVMIGDGELRQEVTDKIAKSGLTDRITLLGFIDNPFPIMKNCKLLCMPSLWEGFGLAAVEAMALGLPVVCSSAGGLPGLVEERCGKICSSAEDYVTEIGKLLSDTAYLTDKRNAARARAAELDNYISYKEALRKVYDDAVSDRSHPHL